MILKSFGCSFIFGTELSDDAGPGGKPSELTWPALLSQQLGLEHHGRGQGGAGNLRILERVISELSLGIPTLYVIGWTWIDRFDYGNPTPTCMADEWGTIVPSDSSTTARAYYQHVQSDLHDKFTSLMCVKSAVDILTQHKQPFVMTYMDSLMMNTTWHAPHSVRFLQQLVQPYLCDFEGRTFLDWARYHGFEIGAGSHPLDAAHQAAVDVILPRARLALDAGCGL
jgi:hypothetical protein